MNISLIRNSPARSGSSRLLVRASCVVGTSVATAAVALWPAPAKPDDTSLCTSGQVSVTAETPQAATTHRALTLIFSRAPDANPCTLTGYPGVDSGKGGPLLHARRTPYGYMGGLPAGLDRPPTITLSPETQAHAVVEGRATDDFGHPCPTYTDVKVTVPDTSQTVTVAATIDSCELQIHPVTP